MSSHPLSFLDNSLRPASSPEAYQLPGMKLNAPSQELHHPCFVTVSLILWGFPGGSAVKDSACNSGDVGLFFG